MGVLDVIGKDWRAQSDTEWLITNGLGGFAAGTVSGAHTRRYHGLLIAACAPPAASASFPATWGRRARRSCATRRSSPKPTW